MEKGLRKIVDKIGVEKVIEQLISEIKVEEVRSVGKPYYTMLRMDLEKVLLNCRERDRINALEAWIYDLEEKIDAISRDTAGN